MNHSLADVLHAAGGRVLAERRRTGDPASVGAALCALPAGELRVPAQALSRLVVLLTPCGLRGGLDDAGEQAFRAQRYAVFHIPAGCGARWQASVPRRQLCLSFDAAAQAGAAGEAPLLNAALAGVRSLADELAAELQAGPAWSAEAADSLARLLLIKVLRQRETRSARHHPLTPQRLRQLAEYVQAHLSERLLVSDLAAAVGLAPARFAQACTATTGLSPHQFLLAQRLLRAQALLHDERLPLAQVAAECGFASQQHLTQVMSRRLGVTPQRYRRAQQGARPAAVPAARHQAGACGSAAFAA